MTSFRIRSVEFDENEDVSAVTAVASTTVLGIVREMVDVPEWTVLSETESQFRIPVQDALTLFDKAGSGSVTGSSSYRKHTTAIWESLSLVVYRIMGE